jgi:hypothetical protein
MKKIIFLLTLILINGFILFAQKDNLKQSTNDIYKYSNNKGEDEYIQIIEDSGHKSLVYYGMEKNYSGKIFYFKSKGTNIEGSTSDLAAELYDFLFLKKPAYLTDNSGIKPDANELPRIFNSSITILIRFDGDYLLVSKLDAFSVVSNPPHLIFKKVDKFPEQ